jgi:hypothetical protein
MAWQDVQGFYQEQDDPPEYPTLAEIDKLRRKAGVLEEDLQRAVEDRAKLKEAVRLLCGGHGRCDCDTDIDRETGELPPPDNAKNFLGDPVWANDVCDWCKARVIIAEVEGAPDA